MRPAIAGIGGYVPAYRLSAEAVADAWGEFAARGIEATAVPAADEDALTMAYEAGGAALDAADVASESIGSLLVATTTPPTEEGPIGPRLANTLGLPGDVATRQLEGHTGAGVEALVSGADALSASGEPALVVAADAPRGEPHDALDHAAGAGAAGVVLASEGPGGVEAQATATAPRPGGRFRRRGTDRTDGLEVTTYDRESYVEVVAGAAGALGGDPGAVDAVALQSPNGSLPYRAADDLGVEQGAIARGTVVRTVGDAGTAGPLLGAVDARRDGAASVLLVGYGAGASATAVRLDCSGVPASAPTLDADPVGIDYAQALRLRGEITPGEPAGGGAYVSVPAWVRTAPQRHRLVAGRCTDCGTLAFPPSGACDDCGSIDDDDPVDLPGTGTVEAATRIGRGGEPPEFLPQAARGGDYVSAVIALDGPREGETVSAPLQVLTPGGESVDIGDRVAATIRRIYTQEGVTRYGTKVRLVDGE